MSELEFTHDSTELKRVWLCARCSFISLSQRKGTKRGALPPRPQFGHNTPTPLAKPKRGFNLNPKSLGPLQGGDLICYGQRPAYAKVLVSLSSLCPSGSRYIVYRLARCVKDGRPLIIYTIGNTEGYGGEEPPRLRKVPSAFYGWVESDVLSFGAKERTKESIHP